MQKQKGISTLTGIIIIVAVATILFGGVFAWQYFATKYQNKVVSWKTYTNSIYNYQINYIQGTKIDENKNGQLTLQYKNGTIDICYQGGFDACGNIPGVAGNEIKSINREVRIDSKKYNLIGWIYKGTEYLHLQLPNNLFVSLNISGQPSITENSLVQALSSFKFINTNQTAGWKTYNNYGFSFIYPSEWGTPIDGIGNKGGELDFDNGFSVFYGEIIIGEYKGAAGSEIQTFEGLVNSKSSSSIEKKDIAIAGHKAVELICHTASCPQLGSNVTNEFIISVDQFNNLIFQNSYGDSNSKNVDPEIFKNIISSVKFTK